MHEVGDMSQQESAGPWLTGYAPGVDWHACLPASRLDSVFDQAMSRFADRPCLDFMGRSYSYAEIGKLTNSLAGGIQQLGVGPGTKVGLFLPNTPFFVISYYAILKTGASVVSFNPLLAREEIINQINDSQTELIITLNVESCYGRLADLVGVTALRRLVVARLEQALPLAKKVMLSLFRRQEIIKVDFSDHCLSFAELAADDQPLVPVDIDPCAVAVLQYTGGTTGQPKAAMLTHANLTINLEQMVLWFAEARPGQERVIGVLPFFHIFAMTVVMNLGLRLGAEIVLLARFEIRQLMETITRTKPTLLPAVPSIFAAINRYRQLGRHDLSSLTHCISGGAPLPAEVKSTFETVSGATLVEGYGLTESSPVATCNPFKGEVKAGSIGQPLPGTVVEIVDRHDQATVLPVGQHGEICIRGGQVMQGYWLRPQDTSAVLRNGRLHTGDVGYMDEQGYCYVVDRIKDLILCKGFNVYPRVVEEAICRHPAVEECVVAGVPDSSRGQSVKAYIKLGQGYSATAGELRSFLQDKLSPIEIPRSFEFRDQLPRTLIGKPSRKDLLNQEPGG